MNNEEMSRTEDPLEYRCGNKQNVTIRLDDIVRINNFPVSFINDVRHGPVLHFAKLIYILTKNTYTLLINYFLHTKYNNEISKTEQALPQVNS